LLLGHLLIKMVNVCEMNTAQDFLTAVFFTNGAFTGE